MELDMKLKVYYVTAIFSLLFAVIGFSYNTWRLEVTEDNSNIRTDSFEVLSTLAQLEQIIFAARYDKDPVEGNPRSGWVKVGLVVDLSALIGKSVEEKAAKLKDVWSKNWEVMASQQEATDLLIAEIEVVRQEIKLKLRLLR